MLKILAQIKTIKGVPSNEFVLKEYSEETWKVFANNKEDAANCMFELVYEDIVDMYDLVESDLVVIDRLVEIK